VTRPPDPCVLNLRILATPLFMMPVPGMAFALQLTQIVSKQSIAEESALVIIIIIIHIIII